MAELQDFARDVSIVVSSCDRFFDAWRPFAFFFREFWPDCPFPIYLIANRLRVRSREIQPINTGRDHGWASNMLLALDRVRTPYILYMQEDYFLTAAIDRERLARDFAYAMEQNAASFCFYDLSLLDAEFATDGKEFGVVPENSKGRTRCQVTLWKRDALISTLRAGETAWGMEARGSERTRGMLILSYARNDVAPIQYLMSGIVRALWTPGALALCRAYDFRVTPAFRFGDAASLRARKFRRAIGRITFPIAYALQRLTPVNLDAID